VEVNLFQPLQRGWIFLKQSWSFGRRAPVLLFPSLAGLVLSLILLLVMTLPLGGMILYIRKDLLGQVAIGIAIGMLLVILLAVFNTVKFLSSGLVGSLLAGQIATVSDTWEKISRLGADLYWMGLGVPVYRVWLILRRIFASSKQRSWADAEHLFIPVLANEAVGMQEAPQRIEKMQTDNCVFTAEGVAVRKLSALLTLGALILGLAAGLGLAWWALTSDLDPGHSRALAFGLGALSIAVFGLPVALYCSYALTLFNNCLYRWGVNVRDARKGDVSDDQAVPEPLAVALGIRSGG
jgi:hypothetical protein